MALHHRSEDADAPWPDHVGQGPDQQCPGREPFEEALAARLDQLNRNNRDVKEFLDAEPFNRTRLSRVGDRAAHAPAFTVDDSAASTTATVPGPSFAFTAWHADRQRYSIRSAQCCCLSHARVANHTICGQHRFLTVVSGLEMSFCANDHCLPVWSKN